MREALSLLNRVSPTKIRGAAAAAVGLAFSIGLTSSETMPGWLEALVNVVSVALPLLQAASTSRAVYSPHSVAALLESAGGHPVEQASEEEPLEPFIAGEQESTLSAGEIPDGDEGSPAPAGDVNVYSGQPPVIQARPL